MKAALAIAVCGVCAAAVGQQARVQYTWTWSEVLANTATPSSATPGVIDPTEGVRLTLHALMTPDVGQPVTYVSPIHGTGTGTVFGWDGGATILAGGPQAQGQFSLPTYANGFIPGAFESFSASSVQFYMTSPWVTGGTPANVSNPVQGLISFTWTPSVYTPREVAFQSEDPITGGFANAMLVRYGTGPTGSPLLTITGAIANHGPGTGGIPIVPGPGAAALLGLGMMMGRRRRRETGKLASWQTSK